jgi:hypothetical protein
MRAGRWVTAVVVAIALGGCSGSGDGDSAGAASGGGPRALPTAESQTVPVDLTFTGAVSGHVTSARTGSKFSCGTPTFPDLFTLSDLDVELNGKTWAFGVSANSYSGPGRAIGTIVITLADPKDSATGFISKDKETTEMTVNEDTRSGTAKAALYQNIGDDKPSVQVSGTWRCP